MSSKRGSDVVDRLLEVQRVQPIPSWADAGVRSWPEFAGMDDAEFEDYCMWLPQVYLENGYRAGLDYNQDFVVDTNGKWGVRFADELAMNDWLDVYEQPEDEDEVEVDRATHAYSWKQPDIPSYTLDQKRAHVVYEKGGYVFLKLPHDPTFIRREGIDMQHPLTGDTRVITYDGAFPIKDLVGQKPRLLTRKAGAVGYAAGFWQSSEIKAYDPQPIFAVELQRSGKTKVIRTTAGHRWYAYHKSRANHQNKLLETRTHELRPGFSIPCVAAKRVLFASESPKGVRLSPVGVVAGVTFGDGSRNKGGVRPARAVLYGEKDASLFRWFSEAHHTAPFNRSVGGKVLHDLPRFFKALPPLDECASYLLGWLAGYVSADGCVSKAGGVTLASAVRENLEFVDTICQRFGIGTSGIYGRTRNGFGKKSAIYTLVFKAGFPIDLLLLSSHRARWQPAKRASEDWVVKSVRATGEVEQVYCAVVPKTGVFALENNILTGNCLSVAHEDYCRRMVAGEIEVYSQTEIATGKPVVDIEVALTKPSYNKPVKEPTVTQIRGPRNQLPPRDEHLPALVDFLENYGGPKGWKITGHNVVNFDGRTDGDVVFGRWKELQRESSGLG